MVSVIRAEDIGFSRDCDYPLPYRLPCSLRERARIGRKSGLSDLGINLVKLPPGQWSSHLHWHSQNEEAVYILDGELILYTSKGREIVKERDWILFPAGVAIAHHLINESQSVAVYIEMGSNKPLDDCIYPQSEELTNLMHLSTSRLSTNTRDIDPYHPGDPSEVSKEFVVRPMRIVDAPAVVNFLGAHPEVALCGWETNETMAAAIAQSSSACFVAEKDGCLIGAVVAGSFGVRASISHLAVHADYRRRGVARKLAKVVIQRFKAQGILRVLVWCFMESLAAIKFWQSEGFGMLSSDRLFQLDIGTV